MPDRNNVGYISIKNQFRPSALIGNPYGWNTLSSGNRYNRADVPTAWADRPSEMTSEQAMRALAYEWLQSGSLQMGGGVPIGPQAGPTGSDYANPPFTSGAAGRLHPLLRDETGQPIRIVRGFIRRSNFEVGDPSSRARLYFMFNPETITRDYVSYLDQASLDPFNTVFQSGNLVAPPSFMNFRFELFFDRQVEATDPNHPGVFVDYQFFDLVVRNVIPGEVGSNNALPDNGVMMVNPRDITVVFSPQITVQGRPINAQITFEKFTHRMVPIRMRIQLEMRVLYFGPLLDQTEYRMQQAESEAEASVPEDEQAAFTFTYSNIVFENIVNKGGSYNATQAQSGSVDAANVEANGDAVFNPSGASGNAQDRGWGAPCKVTGGLGSVFGGGKATTSAGYIADLGSRLLNETARRGYEIRSLGCYCCRHVGGGSCNGGGNQSAAWSNHAWGLAFDINPSENPYQTGPLVTDMPAWMPRLWRSYGFRWGGDYSNKKDAMHYEFMGNVADAEFHTNRAKGQNLGSGGSGGAALAARVAIRGAKQYGPESFATAAELFESPPYEEDDPEPVVPFYSQAPECRVNMPFSCDCSGLVWWSFHKMGLDKRLFPNADAGVDEMIKHFEATQWRFADLLIQWNDNLESNAAARHTLNAPDFLQEGDLLYRSESPGGEGDHVSWFVSWANEARDQVRIYDADPLGTPAVGYRTISYEYLLDSYTHAVRPKTIGALMPYRYAASVVQPLPVEAYVAAAS